MCVYVRARACVCAGGWVGAFACVCVFKRVRACVVYDGVYHGLEFNFMPGESYRRRLRGLCCCVSVTPFERCLSPLCADLKKTEMKIEMFPGWCRQKCTESDPFFSKHLRKASLLLFLIVANL